MIPVTLVIAAFLTVFAAGPAVAQDCAAGLRSFEHALGSTCIPEQAQRIVAPRSDSLATPLLDIGAPLLGTGFSTMEDGSTYVRGASDIFGQAFVDAAGLTAVGDPNQPDFEIITALEPDLILLTAHQQDFYEQMSLIAPTIVVPNNLPFLEHLAMIADAAGMTGVYQERLAAYEAKIDLIKARIGNPEAITVSRLDLWEDGLWYYPNWGAIDQVITDIGFARPPIQAEASENISGLSFERLPEFDGDIVLASRATRFGQTAEMLENQWDSVAPFWRQLPAVAAGNLYWYDRDIWVGYTFRSLDAAADGLLLLTASRFD